MYMYDIYMYMYDMYIYMYDMYDVLTESSTTLFINISEFG
jgi:hypothetical protein